MAAAQQKLVPKDGPDAIYDDVRTLSYTIITGTAPERPSILTCN